MKTIKWVPGTKITKPGMYSGIPLQTYHGDICDGPSVSSSGLKTIFHDSPAHYWMRSYLNPEAEAQDESSALIFGRALHHLMLGEPNFQATFAEQPETYEDEKTGDVKKWHNGAGPCKRWNDKIAKEGRYVLTKKEIEDIRHIATKLATHPLVNIPGGGVLNGLVERSLFWKDRQTGIWLKSRPDVVPTDSGDVVDLKFFHSVDWEDLVRGLYDYGYFQQAALIRTALKEVLDIDMQSFMLFFVEKKNPYSPRPVLVKDIDLEFGAQCNRAALDIMARCLKSGEWPGPRSLTGETIEHIEMSVYAKNILSTKLKLMNYETPDFEGKRP